MKFPLNIKLTKKQLTEIVVLFNEERNSYVRGSRLIKEGKSPHIGYNPHVIMQMEMTIKHMGIWDEVIDFEKELEIKGKLTIEKFI